MQTIKEKIESLKGKFDSSLTKDSTPEEIKEVEARKQELDAIEQEYDKIVKEKQEVTELYIQSQKNQGSKTLPEDDGNDKTPRSLEEIGQSIIDRDSKK